MRRTKIIATLGPATQEEDVLRRLLAAGVDVVRVNLSHGSVEDHRALVAVIRHVAEELGHHVGIMFDTRGPELRLGELEEGRLLLRAGDELRLTFGEPHRGDGTGVSVNYPDLWRDVTPGEPCLIDDGRITATVASTASQAVVLTIRSGGELLPGKKLTFPETHLNLPTLSAEDQADLRLGAELGVDIVAASFVRTAANVLELKEFLDDIGLAALLIAKIETREAVENVERILHLTDGLMVARGDLGVAYPAEEVPIIQKRLIAAANRLGKPVVTATQMLESMVAAPQPTRAEASDVANAIWDGSDAVMLSAETAIGAYPVEAVTVMARIAAAADAALPPRQTAPRGAATVTEAISQATCAIAQELEARAIVTATQSGHTARMVARYRPARPIVAATPSPAVARQLSLLWGTIPHIIREVHTSDDMVAEALAAARATGVAEEGDTVVVTFGVPIGVPGTTNLIQVHTLGGVVVHGRGLGGQIVTGQVTRIARVGESRHIPKGAIVVTRTTDATMAEHLRRARAIIAEEGGLTSHAAILGVSLGIPVIVGAEGALGVLQDGETVTVDARRGVVYRGTPSL